MSANRIHSSSSMNGNGNAFLINSLEQKKIARSCIFRAPKSLQERCLSLVVCFLFVTVTVFIISLWIVSNRWKATLSQIRNYYEVRDLVCETDACKKTAEILISNIDPSADPCEDFYQYACGGWREKHEIPEGRRLVMAMDERMKELRSTLEDLVKNDTEYPSSSESVNKARTFYQACMNDEAREEVGVQPLLDLLKEFGGWPMMGNDQWSDSNYVWHDQVAKAHRDVYLGIIALVDVRTNFENNTQRMLSLESGLFIFSNEFEDSNQTEEACEFIKDVALLLGSSLDNDTLVEEAYSILEFEYQLYNKSFSTSKYLEEAMESIKSLDENITDTAFSYQDLIQKILKTDIDTDTMVYSKQKEYLSFLPMFLETVEKRVIANYIAFNIVFAFMTHSTPELRKLYYLYFYGFDHSGYEHKTCMSSTKLYFPWAIGRLYIENSFPERTRTHVGKMVSMIRLAYSSSLDQNLWMDESTLLYSTVKLQSIHQMIGHEDWIMDDSLLDDFYSSIVNVTEKNMFQTVLMAVAAEAEAIFSSWNSTASRDESFIELHNPAVVNAFYAATINSISLPAGILDYPFYKYGRIDSINYGAIGTVIGHEISHAFDTKGRQFDHEGNLRNWWTNETLTRFSRRAKCFLDQYDKQKFEKGKVNGRKTLAENIADNGGVRSSFKAFRLHLALSDEDFNHRKRLPGLDASPEQLFFLGYASIWCSNMTEEHFKSFAKRDVHSPHSIRVNIPLSNFKEFSKAYKCKPGSAMNPKSKCVMW